MPATSPGRDAPRAPVVRPRLPLPVPLPPPHAAARPGLPRRVAVHGAPSSRPAAVPTTRFVDVGPSSPSGRPDRVAASAGARSARKPAWVRRHKVATVAIVVALVAAGSAVAALLLREDVTTTSSAVAPKVKFLSGTDYASINAAGFATLTLGSSGASASLSLSGVSGAALVTLGNVMKLQNTDATQQYTTSLARSTALSGQISSFVVTIKDGASTLLTWDAVAAATSGSFTLDVSKTLDITIAIVILDGTAAGSLGTFGMQFSLVPV